MRKAALFALMLTLLLTACGGGQEKDTAALLQEQYSLVGAATLEAEVTCHYDDEVRQYTLLCAYTPGRSTITVLSPANLSGISATVEEGTLTLSYEDISLDAGTYSAAAISPVAALPKLMEAAAGGYVTERSEEAVGERQCLRISCDLSDDPGTLYTTWFDQETLLPLRSEISAEGTVVYEVAWTRFEVTERLEMQDGEAGQEESASPGAEDAGTAEQDAEDPPEEPREDQTAAG